MNYRDWLQQLIYKIINPVVHGMIKVGITPNFITTTGLVMNIVAACVFVYAGMYKPGELVYVGWGGGIVLFAGLFDMMDGRKHIRPNGAHDSDWRLYRESTFQGEVVVCLLAKARCQSDRE